MGAAVGLRDDYDAETTPRGRRDPRYAIAPCKSAAGHGDLTCAGWRASAGRHHMSRPRTL
jgi:hypothetical protein